MNLLILGGTQFVGRHITAQALERGHNVTLFNRGKTNADLFPKAEKIIGNRDFSIASNRDGGLEALRERTWDAVIDVNGYLPRLVNDSARLLRDAVAQYVYISTLSVYATIRQSGQNEDAPVAILQDPTTETIDCATYGGLKALCERAVQAVYPTQSTILRLGYVVGPYDPTDRWTSWIRRASRGGEMLAPGEPDTPIQFVDARDVAAFALHVTEQRMTGTYNTTGPATRLTWGELFATAKQVAHADTTFTWVSEEFLNQQQVDFDTLPMFARKKGAGAFTFDNRRALADGLMFRSLEESIRDTLEWDAAYGKPKAGLQPEQEAALLEKWHAQQKNP